MAGQRPQQGWIYKKINPSRVSLSCRRGHRYFYDLPELREINCKHLGCDQTINPSRVFREEHPYIIWTSNEFQNDTNYIQTFTVIPLTSKRNRTNDGLFTFYPITKTSKNGLDVTSYALVHQICTIDGNCFKDRNGDWLKKNGQLDKKDKNEIEETLAYYLNVSTNPNDDWFRKNASSALVKKIFNLLPEAEQEKTLEELMDSLD